MELITAYDLYKLEQEDELLETGLQSLDSLLGGGISPSTFLEIVGLSATGKSQFWYSLIPFIQKEKKICIYKELCKRLFLFGFHNLENYSGQKVHRNLFRNFYFNFDILYSVCS